MGRGRPAGEISRDRRCHFHLSEEEFETVNNLSRITGKKKSDIFREALKMYNNLEMSRQPEPVDDFYYDDFDDFDE